MSKRLTLLSCMHVISYRKFKEFIIRHGDANEVLNAWFKLASQPVWLNLVDIQKVFSSAEAVGNFTVFNIKGNKYRLIVSIDYTKQLVFIKYILTHAEYDKEKWKNDPYF